MMLPSRLDCPLSLKTPNKGNTGLARFTAGANEVFLLSRWGICVCSLPLESPPGP